MARPLSSSTSRKTDAPPGYVADPSVGPMLRFEKSLPNLPVPSISSTAAKYLETVRPHLTDGEYSATSKAVDEFVSSAHVAELQKRLLKRAEGTDSWLSEWWNEAAYMGYRECLPRWRRRDAYDSTRQAIPWLCSLATFMSTSMTNCARRRRSAPHLCSSPY